MRPARAVLATLVAASLLMLLTACTDDEDQADEVTPNDLDEEEVEVDDALDDEDADEDAAEGADEEDADDEDADDGEDADEGEDAEDGVAGARIEGTEPVELDAADQQDPAVLTEVRVGAHEGYERVVWEFAQGDQPLFEVRYVTSADVTEPGTGDAVAVEGDAVLLVRAQSATDLGAEVFAGATPYDGPERVAGADLSAVTEVVRLGDFEANLQWAIGLDRERAFTVEVLEEPLRLVVDVAVD